MEFEISTIKHSMSYTRMAVVLVIIHEVSLAPPGSEPLMDR
jgi:hypothetical protein